METRLRRALDHEEFELWYQPLVRLSDGALLGLEALVRLRAGDGALVNPAAFIPLMEETGLIVALGDWVRREACRQGAAWRALGFEFGSIAVNVSPVEIARGGLVERLRETLHAQGLPAACLEIEITESGLMVQGERAEAMVAGLAALGVKVSLDDFGTGYSSLAHLKRFKVDKLKIDRSFIRDLPSDAQGAKLVGAIVAMGHSLELTVLAEGVETEAQADFLRMRGCQAAQGYHFSKPMDAASLFARYAGTAQGALAEAQPAGVAGV
jgi:EAL domain-containing protein (putative c-di-GMP-specific phosphodiesterase class I)